MLATEKRLATAYPNQKWQLKYTHTQLGESESDLKQNWMFAVSAGRVCRQFVRETLKKGKKMSYGKAKHPLTYSQNDKNFLGKKCRKTCDWSAVVNK